MQVIPTGFPDMVEILPAVYPDDRGWFLEFYKESTLQAHGVPAKFPQENMSFSNKGVIRGLHFQLDPFAQGKLVSVIKGRVLDVSVDLRPDSPTYLKLFYYELSGERHNMLFVPPGFAHGFAALEESIFFYKCTNVYSKQHEGGIVWNDPDLNIDWGLKNPIVSEKDNALPTLKKLLEKSVLSR